MIKFQDFHLHEDFEIFSDKKYYCAHPHLRITDGGYWVLIFNQSPKIP